MGLSSEWWSRLKEFVPTSAFPWKEIVVIVFSMRGSSHNLLLTGRNHQSSHARPAIQALVHTPRRLWPQHHFLSLLQALAVTWDFWPSCPTCRNKSKGPELELVTTSEKKIENTQKLHILSDEVEVRRDWLFYLIWKAAER